jgi:hypothetical protein
MLADRSNTAQAFKSMQTLKPTAEVSCKQHASIGWLGRMLFHKCAAGSKRHIADSNRWAVSQV